MRAPIYRIVNDDDPNDYDYPMAATLTDLRVGLQSDDKYFECLWADVGQRVTIGGDELPLFSIIRIR